MTHDPHRTDLKSRYDVIVCGSGSSGSVIARRLSDISGLRVLLLEAGGGDGDPRISEPSRWQENLGGEADWGYAAEKSDHIGGRAIPMSMGKVLGGGSSINVMIWARGHRRDWDHYADVSGDPGWRYDAVLDIYRAVEDWQGRPDPRRGTGGLVTVSPAKMPGPLPTALLESARALGIPSFDSPNGAMMEAPAGTAFTDLRIVGGRRSSIFESYVRPVIDRPNLTVFTNAFVRRVLFEGRRAIGVEVEWGGRVQVVHADLHVVLSTGAINTPKVLMLSGIGDRAELGSHGIDVVHHLPGVGRGLQDHTNFPVISSYPGQIQPQGSGCNGCVYAQIDPASDGPDVLMCQSEYNLCSPEAAAAGVPEHGWSLVAALSQPRSRGRVSLRSADPSASPVISLEALSDPDDRDRARSVVQFAREIGNGAAFSRLGCREILPGTGTGVDLDEFIRISAMTYWHQSCTARMGLDDLSVVGANLRVHGIDALTVADASILPRISAGNTMAPSVIIGERAAGLLRAELT